MKFMFIYHGGNVPPEKSEENIDLLWKWVGNLEKQGVEKERFVGYGHQTISQNGIADYKGKVFGMSIIETDSIETALALTRDWPELQYGGKIDVFSGGD